MNIDYPVIMKRSDEGYAVGCSALPGCWSQGSTEEEALANIRIAIEEYLEARQSLLADEEDVRTVTVSIAGKPMPSIPGVGHQQAIRVFEKIGFKVICEGKHTVMSDGCGSGRFPATTLGMRLRWVGLQETLAGHRMRFVAFFDLILRDDAPASAAAIHRAGAPVLPD